MGECFVTEVFIGFEFRADLRRVCEFLTFIVCGFNEFGFEECGTVFCL